MTIYIMKLNGRLYGTGNSEYMCELFRDYVLACDIYGRDKVTFEVIRKEDSRGIS